MMPIVSSGGRPALGEGMTFPFQDLHTKILDLLKEGPKTRAEIAQHLHLGSGRVTILLGYLAKTRQIESVASIKNARGYAMNLWSLKGSTPTAPSIPESGSTKKSSPPEKPLTSRIDLT
jgi:hypothetical protein